MFQLLLLIITTILINHIIANQDLIHNNNNESKFSYTTAQLHKWHKLFVMNFEPRLTHIEKSINDLLEKAHVWDTFQLHFSAWNQQLASIDKKIDIINNITQDNLIDLITKLEVLTIFDYKIDEILRKFQKIDKILTNLNHKSGLANTKTLRNEVAIRDIRNIVKNIEKTNDFLIKPKQCKTSEIIEDISSKIDIIFDKITINDDQNYIEEEEDDLLIERNKRSLQNNEIPTCEQFTKEILECNENFINIEKSINKQIDNNFQKYFNSITEYFENLLDRRRRFKLNPDKIHHEPDKNSCEDLDNNQPDGIYNFGVLSKLSSYHHKNSKYCMTRNNHRWTIIQNRNNYHIQQDFNLSWNEYKSGFGDLNKDFWLGNDLIYELTKNNAILRIELEDFNNNYVWAEFYKFKISSEHNNYRLIIANYHGNASDSFTSHNGSFFSTYDRKNDQAPDCCPCAVSYGGGWWFNSCFESNLNGIYHRNPYDNGHYGGIIWENWLGDYSLKKSIMMIRAIEDP